MLYERVSFQDVDFTPWPADRPYAGGFRYNCMVLEVGTKTEWKDDNEDVEDPGDFGGHREPKSHSHGRHHQRRGLWGKVILVLL